MRVLGLVSQQAADLRKTPGKADERKLNGYLESVRAVERRVQADLAFKVAVKPAVDEKRLVLTSDPDWGDQQDVYLDTMFGLIYLALPNRQHAGGRVHDDACGVRRPAR